MTAEASPRAHLRGLPAYNRFAAAILGGWLFTYGFVALATLLGFVAGIPFFESWSLAWMLSFVVFLVVLIWGFTPRRTWVVWTVLAGGGIVMSVAAKTLAPIVAA